MLPLPDDHYSPFQPDPAVPADVATVGAVGACAECLRVVGVDPQVAAILSTLALLTVRVLAPMVLGWLRDRAARARQEKSAERLEKLDTGAQGP